MGKKPFVLLSAISALVVCILLPTVSSMWGYRYFGVHWNKSPGQTIPYKIYEGGSPDIPDDSEITAIRGSFQNWQNDVGSYVAFNYEGLTPSHTNSPKNMNQINEVDFMFYGSSMPIATTWIWSTEDTLEFLEADTVFNEYYNFSTNLAPYSYDVANVMMHEAGHFLSLDDTYDVDDSEQTMYGYTTFQETKKRTLEWGDRAGVRYIYPNRYQAGSGSLGWYGAGADVAVGNVDGTGSTDMVMLWVDDASPNYVKYRFGWNLYTNTGEAASWSQNKEMPGGIQDDTSDAGVALVNLDATSNLDMVVLWVDTASPHNNVRYRIGWNLNTAGDPSSWSSTKSMPSTEVGVTTHGADVAFVNLDANTRPEMVVLWVDSPGGWNTDVIYYKIGWNVDTSGNPTSWSSAFQKIGAIFGDADGAGVSFANIDEGAIDMVVFWIKEVSGANHGEYIVGFNVSSSGAVSSWHNVRTFPGDWQWVGDWTDGAGIATVDLNGNGRTELIFLWVDDPYWDNYVYYRVEWEGREGSHP